MSLVSVLISSFDGYAFCWPAVCHGFSKYWPDCPYPIFLMSNVRDYEHPGIRMLHVDGGKDWTARMLSALSQLDSPYILYFQEDYWIREKVESARIAEYVGHMETHALNYIRLVAKPPPDEPFPHDSRLGVVADDAPYRASVQNSLWRREVFRNLLCPGETVQAFEQGASRRSRGLGKTFLSVQPSGHDDFAHGIRYVCTAIRAGMWERRAVDYAHREGIDVDFSTLPMETWLQQFEAYHPLGIRLGIWRHRCKMMLRDPRAWWTRALARLRGQ